MPKKQINEMTAKNVWMNLILKASNKNKSDICSKNLLSGVFDCHDHFRSKIGSSHRKAAGIVGFLWLRFLSLEECLKAKVDAFHRRLC